MEYCKYHPVEVATYECFTCHTFNCDDCCNEVSRSANGICFTCRGELISLGVSNNVVPFWRRLQESFSYPINFESILFIIGLSLLTTVTNLMFYSIYSLLFKLLLTSALLKYCFSCLDNTSHGNLTAPEMTQAFGGGFGIALKVFFMVMVTAGMIWATSYFLGDMLASIVAIILIAGFPAMMINFAMTEDLVEALNPMNMLNMMGSIGLPYGLLLAFIMIMTGSVGVISQFIGSDFSFISLTLQSIVSTYYTIVIFHIMGYMLYQYQDELGLDRGNIIRVDTLKKTVLEKTLVHVDILIKEGDSNQAIVLLAESIESHPSEKQLLIQYFELLLATKSSPEMDKFAPKYFDYLLQNNQQDKIPLSYKRVLKINAKFNPDTAEQRLLLAKICSERGDAQSVIRLVNGMHKLFPEFPKLVEAYTIMAEALESLPNMQVQAKQCRKLIDNLNFSQSKLLS